MLKVNGAITKERTNFTEKKVLRNGFIITPEQLSAFFPLTEEEIVTMKKVSRQFPMKISPHALSLIKKKGDVIWKQFVPSAEELMDGGKEDPLNEEGQMPIPDVPLVNRYGKKVLFIVSTKCAANCRNCVRKRRVDRTEKITMEMIGKGIDYIMQNKEIIDVVLSGGDPSMLDIDDLDFILKSLGKIPHLKSVRVGMRTPSTYPQAITEDFCRMIRENVLIYRKEEKGLMVGVHFEHPNELTQESREACYMLLDCGIRLYNQNVLLKGINDNWKVLYELYLELSTTMGVQPYYLYRCDPVIGTGHFRTTIEEGIEIMRKLHESKLPGTAIPKYIFDIPGGRGKIPVDLGYVQFVEGEIIVKSILDGKSYKYSELLEGNGKEKKE